MHIHQAGPVDGWTTWAQSGHRVVALSLNSAASSLIVALTELMLLLWLLMRWLVRREGGRRRFWRRLTRQVRLTRQAFSDPIREFLRFRAAVRQLTRLLAPGSTTGIAHHALDGAQAAARRTAPQAFGFAVTVRPASRREAGEVAVRLAGRGLAAPEHPWEADDDPLTWYATDIELLSLPDEDEARRPAGTARVLVPLGLSDQGVVFLDLMRGPRILSTYGDRKATRAFVQAAAAYLDLPGGSVEVVVAKGVHPRFDGPALDSVLASLAADATPEWATPVVVVCAAPDDEQAERLSELADSGVLCALVIGPLSAHRWEVRVNSRGRTETPGLGIETDAAPLGPAVARTARKSGVRKQGTQPAGRGPRPSGPRPPAGGGLRRHAPETPSAAPPRHGFALDTGDAERRQPPAKAPEPWATSGSARGTVARSSTPAGSAAQAPVAGPLTGTDRPKPHRPLPGGPAAQTSSTPERPTPGVGVPASAGAVLPHRSTGATAVRGTSSASAAEPLAPAVRDLFAEPETTDVSAAGMPDVESFDNTRSERRNEA